MLSSRSLQGLLIYISLVGILLLSFFFVPESVTKASPHISSMFHQMTRPEPLESLYFFGIIILVLGLGSAVLFLRKEKITGTTAGHHHLVLSFVILGILFFALGFMPEIFSPSNFWSYPLAAVIALTIVVWPVEADRLFNRLQPAIIGLSIFLILSLRIQSLGDLTNAPWWTDHFQTLFHSIQSVSSGIRPAGDYVPQYGLNVVYLKYALFQNTDPIFTLTIVLSILYATALFAIYFFSSKGIRNAVVRTLFLSALVVMVGFNFKAEHGRLLDPYYQYYPVRILGPALGLALVVWWSSQTDLKNWKLILSGITLGLLPTFNLDSGLPTLVICIVIFSSQQFKRKKNVASVALVIAGTLISSGCFVLLVRPPLSEILSFQEAYFSSGIAMIPAPRNIHLWHFIFALYIWEIIWNLKFRRNANDFFVRIYLAWIGLSLFLYFAGRSQDENLLVSSWPALVIVFLHLDRLFEVKEDASFIFTRWVFLVPAFFLFLKFFNLVPAGFNRLSLKPHPAAVYEALKEKIADLPKDCELVSGHGAILRHMNLARMEWGGRYFSEQVFQDQHNDYLNFLSGRTCLIVDRNSLGGFVAGKAIMSEVENLKVKKFYLD